MKASVLRAGPTELLLLLLGALSGQLCPTEARKLSMRPLSAHEVYRLLYATGRAHAVPQGRIITQGLAAIAGFTTGITNAYRGVGAPRDRDAVTTHEICFNTRQARSLAEAEAIIDAYVDAERHSESEKVRLSEASRRITINRRHQHNDDEVRRPAKRIKNRDTQFMSEPGLGTPTAIATNTGTVLDDTATYISPISTTLTENPETTAARTGTSTAVTQFTNPTISEAAGSGEEVDTDTGLGTTSTFTTWTAAEGAINCLVIRQRQ